MEYTLQSPKWEGEIRLKYHDNGHLAEAIMPEVINVDAARHMATIFPLHESVLNWYRKNTTTVKITQLAADTSFENFWKTYNQKRGSKIRAMQYWDGEKRTLNRRPITVTDREDIMRMLKHYAARYRGPKKEYQPLASTFLHERMWESEIETEPKTQVDLLKLIEERRKNNG